MTKKELTEKRSALMSEVDGADEKRFAEIKTEIEKIDYQLNDINESEKRAKEKQVADDNLAAREKTPTVSETSKRAKTILATNGTPTVSEDATADVDKQTLLRNAKTAFAKEVRSKLNGLPVNLSAGEKRALGVAITTTSDTYVASSQTVNGVNNGGVFIPQTVLYDLLEVEEVNSAFYRDVKATHLPGVLVFPYVIDSNNGTSKGVKETEKSNDRSIKWGKLTLAQGNYPLTIEVTMELLAMTDEQFTEYLLNDLSTELNLLLADEVLYGTGKDDRIEGVTVGAIPGTAYKAGGEPEAIKAGLLTLSHRARRGAKVYISQSMALEMTFEKGTDGHYIFPIYNSVGITKIASIPVEVDESLKDGDFVIGNAANYKLNFTKDVEVYPEVHGKTRIIEYTAHVMVGGKAAPNKFYYGKKSTTSDT